MRLAAYDNRIKKPLLTVTPAQNRLRRAHPFPPALARPAKITFPLIFIIH
jgi:hypothetical protein